MNILFKFMRSKVRDKYYTITGTKICEKPSCEHWSVFEDTKFSKSLYLSIEGKIYAHFEDFFKYEVNKDICERVAMKIENYKKNSYWMKMCDVHKDNPTILYVP